MWLYGVHLKTQNRDTLKIGERTKNSGSYEKQLFSSQGKRCDGEYPFFFSFCVLSLHPPPFPSYKK